MKALEAKPKEGPLSPRDCCSLSELCHYVHRNEYSDLITVHSSFSVRAPLSSSSFRLVVWMNSSKIRMCHLSHDPHITNGYAAQHQEHSTLSVPTSQPWTSGHRAEEGRRCHSEGFHLFLKHGRVHRYMKQSHHRYPLIGSD